MTVLICGSRYWAKPGPIGVLVAGLAAIHGAENVTVLHGGARGADSMAGAAAAQAGVLCNVYHADWPTHGKAAGPRRNQWMLEDGKPEMVFAFTDGLQNSPGTADMVARARKVGLPVYIIGRAP